ncbi:hypothetical protein IWQ61_000221 [Dispira simplex]|nr:hypothetical protein IWQ61_000221 [Dispira simplex]
MVGDRHDGSQFPSSKWGRILLSLLFISFLAFLAIELVVLAGLVAQGTMLDKALVDGQLSFELTDWASTAPALGFTVIIILAALAHFCVWWIALVKKNLIECFVFILFGVQVLILSTLQCVFRPEIPEIPANSFWASKRGYIAHKLPGFMYGAIGIAAVQILAVILVQIPLYKEIAWTFYKKLGSDPKIRRMNIHHYLFLTFLTLDMFFFLCYIFQALSYSVSQGQWQAWLRLVAGVVVVASLVVGMVAATREKRIPFYIFMGSMVLILGYFIAEVVMLQISLHGKQLVDRGNGAFLSVLGVFCLVQFVITAGVSIRVLRNFSQGLLEHRVHINRVGDPADGQVVQIFSSNRASPRKRNGAVAPEERIQTKKDEKELVSP